MSRRSSRRIPAADLFCGAGGLSVGLKEAARELGIELGLTAINHWSVAIATHSSNHPDAKHLCTGVHDVEPRQVVPDGYLKLLCAAPECVHFSTARGGKPMSDQSRSSAMDLLRWARELTIDNILIENVPEFRTWGPLHKCTCGLDDMPEGWTEAIQQQIDALETKAYRWKITKEAQSPLIAEIADLKSQLRHKPGFNCHRPIKHLRGIFFQRFIRGLQALGYTVEHRVLNAANYGDATTRKRFFLQAKLGGVPITWPEPTHLPKELLKAPDLQITAKAEPFRTAREIIDWSLPGRSIFGRKKPLAPKTLERIFAGLRKYSGLPFIVPQFSEHAPKTVDGPLGTITSTSRGIGLAEPFLVILRNNCDAKSVDEPAPTVVANGNHVGLAVPKLEPIIIANRNNNLAKTVDEPIPPVCTGNHIGLVEPELTPFIVPNFGEADGQEPRSHSVDDPLPTVTSHGAGCLVEPCIIALEHGGDDHNGRTQPVDEPLKTVTAKGQFGLVEPYVIAIDHNGGGSNAIGVDEPIGSVTTKERFAVVEPELKPFVLGQQSQAQPRDVDQPIPTVAGAGAIGLVIPDLTPFVMSAGGPDVGPRTVDEPLNTVLTRDHMAVVEPVIVNMKGRSVGRSVDEPLPTLTAHAPHVGVLQPVLIKYHGSHKGKDDHTRRTHSVEEPIPTLDTANRFGLAQPALVKFNGTGSANSVDEPLDTITAKDRFGLVLPELKEGESYALLDIKFRMLQPHELAAAMSFPKDYKFSGNREAVVRQIGNAVACRVAKALCREILAQ